MTRIHRDDSVHGLTACAVVSEAYYCGDSGLFQSVCLRASPPMCARVLEGVRTSTMVTVVICLFVLMELTAAQPQLNVVYPERDDNQNYSVVTLSCQESAISAILVQNAIYQRNGAGLGTVVNVIDLTVEDVTFVFTQEQEGWFTCGPNTNNMSPSIGLAGRSERILSCACC